MENALKSVSGKWLHFVLVLIIIAFCFWFLYKEDTVKEVRAVNASSLWAFEEASGTNVLDSVGSNNGTLVNGVLRVALGRAYKAIKTDGVDDYVNLGDGASLELQNFSISLWVRRIGAQPDFAKILSKGNTSAAPWGSYKLELDGSSDTIFNWHLGFTDGTSASVKNQTPLPDGHYTHILGTFDGSNIKLYVNGILQATSNVGSKTVMYDTTPLTLGGTALSGYFRADIDEVKFFNTALTNTEVMEVYNEAPSLVVTSPNTLVNWAIGSIHPITWTHNMASSSTSKIEISRNAGSTWTQIVASTPNGSGVGTYNWNVTGAATTQGLIKVTPTFTHSGINDVSNAQFTIANPFITVTSPNQSSDVWTIGQPATITWTDNLGSSENVKIELSTNGGSTYPIMLSSSTPSDGSQTITVPSGSQSTTAKVKITWLKTTSILDVSNANFTITGAADSTPPTVSITSPTNNQVITTSTPVTATASDNVGVVGVQFKVDGNNLGSEDTSSPYSTTFNPSLYSSGNHVLTAVARDGAGNQTTSSPVTVIVTSTLSQATFQPSSAIFPNPDRGFYNWTEISYPDVSFVRNTEGNSLTRVMFRLDNYRTTALPQSYLDDLDNYFDVVRNAGIKAIIRFNYDTPDCLTAPCTSYGDATVSRIQGHLNQLAPVLAANEDVISSMEAGFIGWWGEWHHSTNGSDTTAGKQAVINAVLNALPTSRMVGVRMPYDMRLFQGGSPISQSEAFNGSNKSRIGSHQDCFLASNDDWGTWGVKYQSPNQWVPSGYTIAQDKAYIRSNALYTVVGGETCNVNPPRSNCPTALSELEYLNFSNLNEQFEPTVIQGWKTQGCFDEIDRRLGYRYELLGASYTGSAPAGGSFQFNFQVVNRGYAAMFNERPVFAVLKSGSNKYTFQLNEDPREWKPTVNETSNNTFTLPGNIVPGTYTLALWLPDEFLSIRNNPFYAVQFANTGVWNAAEGYNVISNNVTITP